MFCLKTADPTQLQNIISAAHTIIEEATFNIGPEDITLRAMDPLRVAMLDLKLPKSIFEEYECAEPMKICVYLTELLKLLRRANKEDTITLSLDESERLQILIEGAYTRSFTMPLLEPHEEDMPMPKVTLTAKAKLTTEGLKQIVEDSALVSDHLKITTEEKRLNFDAHGDLMSGQATLDGSAILLNLEVSEPAKATFSLIYLTDILAGAVALSDLVTMELASDMPLRLDFKLAFPDGELVFWLAPRIKVE